MKKYDNFFIPVDDLEMAKKYYENNLGLKVKFDFSIRTKKMNFHYVLNKKRLS